MSLFSKCYFAKRFLSTKQTSKLDDKTENSTCIMWYLVFGLPIELIERQIILNCF